jgi:hypothetical protein
MVKQRKSQCFEDHLCPRLQVTDVSGETVHARYRPARGPRSNMSVELGQACKALSSECSVSISLFPGDVYWKIMAEPLGSDTAILYYILMKLESFWCASGRIILERIL